MIERYTLPEMARLWSEENKFNCWLKVEILACEALMQMGRVPRRALEVIKRKAGFDVKRIERLEFGPHGTGHDLIAFLTCVSERIGPEAHYLHMGLTSYDVEDTALSLRMKESADIIISDLNVLQKVLKRLAWKHRDTIMIGRTHGVHAEPTTFGLKMAVWQKEVERNITRMGNAKDRISVGKLSGAVGTFAHIDPNVESYVCKKLGLKPAPVSTQILQRDRHAEYLLVLALIASSLEKFATEIRNLQRTELREVEEHFTSGQKGSSAMPHKRNPMRSERICSLARVVRANSFASLENIPLWHERDLTNSASERVIIPDSCILVNYMLRTFTKVMENLVIYPERMRKNINSSYGLVYSQRVLLLLTEKGLSRRRAYEVVQKNAMQAWEEGCDFKELLLNDLRVRKYLSEKELDSCFDPAYFLRNVSKIFNRLLA